MLRENIEYDIVRSQKFSLLRREVRTASKIYLNISRIILVHLIVVKPHLVNCEIVNLKAAFMKFISSSILSAMAYIQLVSKD